jgi:putative tricarboxylic transport membrane protein
MEMIDHILYGFSVSLAPINLFHCLLGVLIGTLVGVLPGLGPAAAVSILVPLTFRLSSPVSALIMLAGIFYGGMYGGSTTSILVNIPGESASVVTCLDGYQMARNGRAGAALGISAFGSFIAGTLGVVGLMVVAPPLSRFALKFGPPEYCGLMVLAFSILGYIATGSMIKAFMMTNLGLMLGCVGADFLTGTYRFTYGLMTLEDGLGMVPVVMGLFGISEVISNVEQTTVRVILKGKIKGLFPNKQDWKESLAPIGRGGLIGFALGLLPGAGPVIASFMSYIVEKRISKRPERFGQGEIAGVAAPEAANNAAASAAFVPMLTLGIPATPTIAILLGALLLYGVVPGPLLMKERPDIFWGTITSMYTGNAMLLVLNVPLIPLWVQVLKVPYPILCPLILLFCITGVYSINGNIGDIIVMNVFGIIGYFMKKVKYEGAPFILAFILGPMFENSFRQSLMMSHGHFSIFLRRPITLCLLLMATIIIVSPLLVRRRPKLGYEDS